MEGSEVPVRGIVRKEYSHKHAHIPSVAATWRAHGSERQDGSAKQAPNDVCRIQTPITTVICTTAPKRAAYIVGGLPVPFSVAWVEPVLLVIRCATVSPPSALLAARGDNVRIITRAILRYTGGPSA